MQCLHMQKTVESMCIYLHITWVYNIYFTISFPHSSVSRESACNAGDPVLIPGSGRSPGEGNGNPLQYSCLENPVDRGAWWATAHGVTRVGHDLATKPPPRYGDFIYIHIHICIYR